MRQSISLQKKSCCYKVHLSRCVKVDLHLQTCNFQRQISSAAPLQFYQQLRKRLCTFHNKTEWEDTAFNSSPIKQRDRLDECRFPNKTEWETTKIIRKPTQVQQSNNSHLYQKTNKTLLSLFFQTLPDLENVSSCKTYKA